VSVIDYAGLSDIGCERSSNQDRWSADAELGLYVVADGVAGSSDGELAAQVIAELLPTYLRRHLDGEAKPAQLGRAVAELSNDLYLTGQTDSRVAGATSTVVAVVVAGSRALVAHMGDSRVYLYRERQLTQLTRDHSLVQALIDSHEIKPEDAARHPARNVVIRFVGMPPPAIPDAADVELQDGDRILLCSDGLFGVVDDAALAGIVGAENVPTDACAALIAAARQAGGPDNITAVVVHISDQ
jgi:serine/threonine protein phosphatase PrpC